jgi:hypothetical protein
LVGVDNTVKLLPLLEDYLQGLEFYNGALQYMVSPEPLWYVALGFLYNRKLFFRGDEVVVQCDDEVELKPYTTLKLDHVRSFYYNRTVSLPSGQFNYQLAFTSHERTAGLGTLRLEMDGGFVNYPPTNIIEMVQSERLTVFNAGRFALMGGRHKLHKFEITIDESGTALKRLLEFHYVDFKPCAVNGLEPLFYTLNDNTGCHPLEKRLHIALDILIDGDGDLSKLPVESIGETLEQFITRGTRKVKMLNASDQRMLREVESTLRPWKLSF